MQRGPPSVEWPGKHHPATAGWGPFPGVPGGRQGGGRGHGQVLVHSSRLRSPAVFDRVGWEPDEPRDKENAPSAAPRASDRRQPCGRRLAGAERGAPWASPGCEGSDGQFSVLSVSSVVFPKCHTTNRQHPVLLNTEAQPRPGPVVRAPSLAPRLWFHPQSSTDDARISRTTGGCTSFFQTNEKQKPQLLFLKVKISDNAVSALGEGVTCPLPPSPQRRQACEAATWWGPRGAPATLCGCASVSARGLSSPSAPRSPSCFPLVSSDAGLGHLSEEPVLGFVNVMLSDLTVH